MTALIEYVSKFAHALNAVNGFLKLFFNTRHSNSTVAALGNCWGRKPEASQKFLFMFG